MLLKLKVSIEVLIFIGLLIIHYMHKTQTVSCVYLSTQEKKSQTTDICDHRDPTATHTLERSMDLPNPSTHCMMLWNSRGISVHAFEFSLAENLSAQHMGKLGATLRQVLTQVRTGGWRCHSDVIIVRDETRWQGAGDVTHRRRAEVCGRFEGSKSRVLDAKREGLIFGARRREANERPMRAARDGGQMNKTA